jgi:hypothetical protein
VTHPPPYRRIPLSAEEKARGEANLGPHIIDRAILPDAVLELREGLFMHENLI